MAADFMPIPGCDLADAEAAFEWVDLSVVCARVLIPRGQYAQLVERAQQMYAELGCNGDIAKVEVARADATEDDAPPFDGECIGFQFT